MDLGTRRKMTWVAMRRGSFKKCLLECTCFTMLYYLLLYSKVSQSYVYIICLLFLRYPFHLGHHRALNTVPYAIEQIHIQRSDQIRSVAQSCPTLFDPMNRSTPGLPVHHQLPEFTQTHVHRVSDAIQPSHPLSSPSPPAPNPSQHQSFFQ